MLSSPRIECASVEQTICTPASTASRTCSPARSSRFARPLTSSATPVSIAASIVSLEIERVLGPVADEPSGRVAQAARRRMAHGFDDACGQFRARCALPAMERDLHPVELGEHVLGNVEAPVGTDVALHAAQDPEWRKLLVGGRDFLALTPQRVAVEPGDDGHAGRVVADRQILVAAIAGGHAHLQNCRPAVRPDGVRVEIATDLSQLYEQRGLRIEPLIANLGRRPAQTE